MAILGLFTTLGLQKTKEADQNEGFYIHPTSFGVSRNVGPLDASRTGANSGQWYQAPISGRENVDYNTLKFICTIPPQSSGVVEPVKEVYVYAKDSSNNDFLLALGQPTENIIYDPDGTITLEIQISLVDVDLTKNYVFNFTNATDLEEHKIDPTAHPEISEAMAKAGIFVKTGSIAFDYVGQDFEDDVEFEGTKATVNYGGLTFSAKFNGTEQNGIALVFDGVKDADTVVTEWNNANSNQIIQHNGTGSEVLSAGTATLTGGTYVVQNKDLVYRDSDGVYKRALADGSYKAKAVAMALRSSRRVVMRGLMNYTSGQPVGTILYLSAATYGGFQTVNNGISLGIVLKSNLILFTGFSGAAAVNINQSFDAIVTNTTGLGLFSSTQAAIDSVPVNGRILIDIMEDLKTTLDTQGKNLDIVFNGPAKGWQKFAGAAASFKIEFASVPTAGTWRMEWDGQESADMAYNATALDVQTEFNLFAGHTGVTVTGDYTSGFTFVFADNIPQPVPTFSHTGLNEVQRFNLGNIPDNGTVTFEHEGNTSANYAWNDTPAQLEAYLEALPSIDDIDVSGSFASGFFQIEFIGGVLVDGLQPQNPITVVAKTLNLGGTDTTVNGSNSTPINPITVQQGKYPASNLRNGVTPIAITVTELSVGEPVGPDTAIVLDAPKIRLTGYGTIKDFALGVDLGNQDETVVALRFENTTRPVSSGDQLPGVDTDLSGIWGYAKDIFSQMRVTEHPTNKKRLKISTANVQLPSGVEMIQELENLMLDFDGAEIDFSTGNVYTSDGVTTLGLNFTPVIPVATAYRWASLTIIPKSVSNDLKMVGQVLVLFGSADGATSDLAPKAPFGDGKPLAQVVLTGDLGKAEVTRVIATRDEFQSLHQKFFKLHDDVGSVGVWFDVNNQGATAPAGALACARQIAVTTINENDNPNVVAQKIQAVLDADSKFSATVSTNRITVTDASLGARTDATPETSGFYIDVLTQGVATDVTGLSDITNEDIKQLGVGSGGGSGGIGDGDIFQEDLKAELQDSFYSLLDPNVFELSGEDKLSTNEGEYLIADKRLELDAGEKIVSTDHLSPSHFKAKLIDLDKVALTIKYDPDYIDSNPTVEVSRDGGVNFQAISVEQNEVNGVYQGELTFADESIYSSIIEYLLANADATLALNSTTAQQRSQEFTTPSEYNVLVQLAVSLNKIGSPSGYLQALIVNDNAGSPSTSSSDIVWASAPIFASDLSVGNNTSQITIPKYILSPSTKYHLVFITDASYKTSYVAVTHQLGVRVDSSSPTIANSKTYDGATWASVAGNSIVHKITGRTLDLRVRITASETSRLIGYGVFYRPEDRAANTRYNETELIYFQGSSNKNTFTLVDIIPNPDFLEACLIQTGQVWKYPAFEIQGQNIVFPANSFNIPNTTLGMRFDQSKGGSYDNSDRNVQRMAENHMYSSDATLDLSSPGRGYYFRRPDGTVRELTFNNTDGLAIYSSLGVLIGTIPIPTDPVFKYQEKFLSANFTTSGTMSDLTFNNLTPGKRYRARIKFVARTGDATEVTASIVHNGSTLDIARVRGESNSAGSGGSFYGEATFVATATTLTFVCSGATTGRIVYGGFGNTKSILEEVPYHSLTTDWT